MTERSRNDLEQARAKWWATVSTGDLDGYLDLFAEDAVWVTPELDEVVGRDAIRSWLAPVFAQFDYELTITVADVRVAGDLGIERARFLSRMTPKPPAFRPQSAPAPIAPAPDPPEPVEVPDEAAPASSEGTLWAAADGGDVGGGEVEEGASEGSAFEGSADDTLGGDAADHSPADEGAPAEEEGAVEHDTPDEDDAPAEEDTRVEEDASASDDAPVEEGAPEDADDPADETDETDEAREAIEADLGIDADVEAPLHPAGPDAGDDEPHEGRYLMYWRWHDDRGWLVHRYADVTGIG